MGFLIFDIFDTFGCESRFCDRRLLNSTYDKIRVDTLNSDTMRFNLFSQRGRERINEGLGTRVCGKHRGGDNAAERTNVQYQTIFPGGRSVRGGRVGGGNQGTPLDHPRQHNPCNPDGSVHIDCDDVREFGRFGFRKVHRVRMGLSYVVDCATGEILVENMR